MAGRLSISSFFLRQHSHSYLSVMRHRARLLPPRGPSRVRWQAGSICAKFLIEQNNTAFAKNDVKMNIISGTTFERAAQRRRHNIPFAGRGRP